MRTLFKVLVLHTFVIVLSICAQDTIGRTPSSITLGPESSSSSLSENRLKRDKVFDRLNQHGNTYISNPELHLVTNFNKGLLPELPIMLADAIVTGTIQNVGAHLSNNKRVVYSEYSISTEQFLKGSNPAAIKTLDVIEIGGVGLMPDGKIVTHQTSGLGSQIEIGHNYLLFLNYNADGDFFRFVKVWEITNGNSLQCLWMTGRAYRRRDRSTMVRRSNM